MAEIRRGIGPDNRVERLPWLEPVEDEDDYPEEGGRRGWALIGLALLVVAALAIAGLVAFRHWHASRADLGGIIRAPATPYKVRPLNAGGLAVDEGGVVAEQTGTGADVDAPLALVAPEQPVVGPGRAPAEAATPAAPGQPASIPAAQLAAPRPAPVASVPVPAPHAAARPPAVILAPPPRVTPPTPAAPGTLAQAPAIESGGGVVQLGAFGSEAKARTAWKSLSKRFGYLQAMTVGITQAEVNGTTVYRLRAGGGEPSARVCARLQLAGEACTVIS